MVLRKNYHFISLFILFFCRFLKLLGVSDFDFSQVPTGFIFLSKIILISQIRIFLLPKMLMTDRKNTHYCKINNSLHSEFKM